MRGITRASCFMIIKKELRNMRDTPSIDLRLTSALDELFMDEKGRAEFRLPKIHDVPLSEIDDFPDHPFYVRNDEDMDQLVESIKDRGIITPVMLRKKDDGRYEMISGHRRKRACELAGLETIRADVRELTRDEAILLMVDSNLQRSTIMPSEKAFAYKMRLDAMKRQGSRTDLSLSPEATKIDSAQELGDMVGERRDQVFRYIRLTKLIPPLLEMVDEGRIALRPAANLSYLTHDEQTAVVEAIAYTDATPSLAQTIKMRSISRNEGLSDKVIFSILSQEKPNQRAKISIPEDRIRKYIPASMSSREAENYVVKAVEHYHKLQMHKKSEHNAR